MPIQIEAFAVTITDAPGSIRVWTEDLFRTALESTNRIWRTQAGISFSVEQRFNLVQMSTGDFPGGANLTTERLTDLDREEVYVLTQQGVFFAVRHVNTNYRRESPFRIRLHLLPTHSRALGWRGRGLADLVECYCPRPRSAEHDQRADILIAHELGHVLLGPGHHPRAEFLMFMEETSIIRPPQLTPRQRRDAQSSPITIHWQQQPLSHAPHPGRNGDPRVRDQSPLDTARASADAEGQSSWQLLGAGSSHGSLGMRTDRG